MQSSTRYRKTADYGITFVQVMVYLVFSPLSRYFFRSVTSVSSNVGQLRKGSLLVANHQSALDPFLILTRLPFATFLKVLPVRFPTSHRIYKRYKIFALIGCYDVGSAKKEKMISLFQTRQYLLEKNTIMLFPEGKVCAKRDASNFQLGVTFLVEVAESIIFVKMVGFQRSNWLSIRNPQRQLIFSPVYEYSEEFKNIEVIKSVIENLALENSYSV